MNLKTLTALAKSNGRRKIKILSTVLVKDNQAHATNMDMDIIAPVETSDGLYYPHGFAVAGYFKAE